MSRLLFCLAALAMLMSAARAAELNDLIDQPWFPKAPPLPKPTGSVAKVKTAAELYKAARDLKPGGTILVADGTYRMSVRLVLRGDNVALRGESGDRPKVILDFAKSRPGHGEGIVVSRGSGATIANLTIQNIRWNGYKIESNNGVDKVTIHNCVGRNVWQRHVKGVGVPDQAGNPNWVRGCRVQYCLFYNDRPKRRGDDRHFDDAHPKRGFNYIGGIDVMAARDWIIRDNVFVNIHGGTREGRGAIFLWNGCKDCVVERNIIIDCDSGICLGNSSNRKERRHCEGVIVRNNFVTRCPENNLFACHTRDCAILHNTVHDPKSRMRRLIRVVFANHGLVVKNNLFDGPGTRYEKVEGKVTRADNLVRPVPGYFVDPAMGNLHLTEKAVDAINKGAPLKQAAEDIDGAARDNRPDLGADEFGAADE
jgi:hypothetical protein